MTNKIELAIEMIEEINNSEKKAFEFPETERDKNEWIYSKGVFK